MALEEVTIKLNKKDVEAIVNDGKILSFPKKLSKNAVVELHGSAVNLENAHYDERDNITYINLTEVSPNEEGVEDDNEQVEG